MVVLCSRVPRAIAACALGVGRGPCVALRDARWSGGGRSGTAAPVCLAGPDPLASRNEFQPRGRCDRGARARTSGIPGFGVPTGAWVHGSYVEFEFRALHIGDKVLAVMAELLGAVSSWGLPAVGEEGRQLESGAHDFAGKLSPAYCRGDPARRALWSWRRNGLAVGVSFT
jgi:hypothetical protein